MGFSLSLKDLGKGISESLGFKGHDKIGYTVGQWMNNFNGTTDAFNRSVASDWQFWNANNAYNSPSAVMERYKEAGLNPNLIYGHSGTPATGSSGSMSSGGLSSGLSLLRMYFDLRQQDAMTQQVRAQTQLARAQAKALDMENRENFEAGTSRSTPYPIKVVKQAKEAVTPISESLGNTWSSLTYKLYPKWYNNVLDGFINVVGGKDFSVGQPGNYQKLMRRGYGR